MPIICSKIQNLKQSLEVCCDRSTFFPLKSADVRGAGTRDEPPKNVCVGGYDFNGSGLSNQTRARQPRSLGNEDALAQLF